MEALSARYWNHNVVNYDEKLSDGFYDVCGAPMDPGFQVKFPSLSSLRAIPVGRDVAYVVILVNRERDPMLKRLEGRAMEIAAQSRAERGGIASAELVQKIASLVVDAMGGVVEDADAMNREWSTKSRQLCAGLNSIALPLGSLGIGLSRHRSLLFKVLADRVNLPCKLVKGICYTGTDEGAINFVKIDFDSAEYIVDLMGAPGTLIPSEISVSQFQDSNNSQLSSDAIEESVAELCIALEQVSGVYESKNDMGGSSSDRNSVLELPTPHLEDTCHTEKPLKQRIISDEGQFDEFNIEGGISQQKKVNDTSKYLVPGVVDPQFAQNLHDLLLEGGALLPSGLLSCQNSHNSGNTTEMGKNSNPEVKETPGWLLVAQTGQNTPERSVAEDSLPKIPLPPCEDVQYPVENTEATIRSLGAISIEGERVAEQSLANMSGSSSVNLGKLSCSSTKTISSVMDDVAEDEISWEDLHIGERIGLGSYGEVYHADWNGTEVAVKKFLDQDLSGVALEQFKCEAKGMNYLHTSHPTIVHRDLKSPNLLVDKNWVVKVILFFTIIFQLMNGHASFVVICVRFWDVKVEASHFSFLQVDSWNSNILDLFTYAFVLLCLALVQYSVHLESFTDSLVRSNKWHIASHIFLVQLPEWMAPEVLRNEPANEMCDVYSFGVILWELATLRVPWSGLNPMQVVGAVGFQNKRLDIPKERSKQTTIVLPALVTAKEITAATCYRKPLTICETNIWINAKKEEKYKYLCYYMDQVFHVEARGDVFKISAVWMRMDKGFAYPCVKIVCSSAKVVLKKA
ncbi:Serine/threonine-protein kinase CTR1 [Triticum urartu]|uniref:Serine/threonine-protein kinase CTR1 n=1 Tax=Triticum urartu TaxID=4572 RepID=M7YLF9_TRIUA|nr:Serine/threonine-protein kinase CTR1 [Triticum urartu]